MTIFHSNNLNICAGNSSRPSRCSTGFSRTHFFDNIVGIHHKQRNEPRFSGGLEGVHRAMIMIPELELGRQVNDKLLTLYSQFNFWSDWRGVSGNPWAYLSIKAFVSGQVASKMSGGPFGYAGGGRRKTSVVICASPDLEHVQTP
jgi:hypothetical protein